MLIDVGGIESEIKMILSSAQASGQIGKYTVKYDKRTKLLTVDLYSESIKDINKLVVNIKHENN